MKTRADIVQALSELAPADRKWIINRLSLSARNALLGERAQRGDHNASHATQGARSEPAVPSGVSETMSPSLRSAVQTIEQAGASSVAAVLLPEPAWVVHALLQYREWPWSEELQRRLPVGVRVKLAQLDNAAVRYAARVLERLLAMLATRVSADTAAKREAPSVSRFEKLVAGIGATLARRRMRLRR